jgi:uncharacterized membrane protein
MRRHVRAPEAPPENESVGGKGAAESPPRRTREASARAIAAAAVGLWIFAMVSVCWLKFHYFLYTDFDFAIFAQALSGVLHGAWFSSIRGMYWLGDHSSLGLLLLVPLAALVHHPMLLPIVQAVALGAGAWPLYAYARRRLGDERLAAAFAVLWVLQPALSYLALYEFHPETLAVPALLGAAFFLSSGRTWACVGCAVLAAIAKEDVALPLFVLGMVGSLTPRAPRRRAAFALLGIAAASVALSFGVLKPALNLAGAQYGDLYAAWGRTPGGAAAAMLSHPLRGLAAFVSTPGDALDTLYKRQYWPELLLPTLALALLAPLQLLPALPVLAEHFLASRHEQHTIIYQYTALILPFVFLAAIDGFARVTGSKRGRTGAPRRAALLLGVMLAASVVAQPLYGPFAPPSPLRVTHPSERVFPNGRQRALAAYRRHFMAELPAGGAVVADFPSLAALASSDSLYSLHHIARGTFTFSRLRYPTPGNVRAALVDVAAQETIGRLDSAGCGRFVSFVVTSRLKVVDSAGDLLLLTVAPADSFAWLAPVVAPVSRGVRYDGGLEFLGAGLLRREVAPGGLLPMFSRWRRVAALPGQPLMEFALTDGRGESHFAGSRLLGYGLSPVEGWPTGAASEERYRFVVPTDLRSGEYQLGMRVAWRRGGRTWRAVADDGAAHTTGVVPLGSFRIVRP